MSGGGGGSGNTTTVQRADPWEGQQPYLTNLWKEAQALPQMEPYPFPGTVPFSPTTSAGMRRVLAQSQKGVTPIFNMGEMEAARTLGGSYLDPWSTPGFQGAFQAAARNIIPGVESRAIGSGRYGGGLSRMDEIQALGDAFASQWAPLYSSERERMSRAMLAAPSMSSARRQQEYYDIDRMLGVGAQQEARAQQALDDAKARWQFQQMQPYQQLQTIAPIIGGTSVGGMSSTSTRTDRPDTNPIMSGVGGALMGGSLAGILPKAMGITGPMGMAAGAGLGLLASMM
jgi:hypothetical protein